MQANVLKNQGMVFLGLLLCTSILDRCCLLEWGSEGISGPNSTRWSELDISEPNIGTNMNEAIGPGVQSSLNMSF